MHFADYAENERTTAHLVSIVKLLSRNSTNSGDKTVWYRYCAGNFARSTD